MAISRRAAAMVAGGLLSGLAGAWVLFGTGGDAPPPEAPNLAARTAPERSAPAAGTAPAPAVSAGEACGFDPIVQKGEQSDGELVLERNLDGKGEGEVRALLVAGKEAAAAGRRRDAEVAFLMACRAAAGLEASGMPLADARYRLGRHYAMMAGVAAASGREELRGRARALYASSLQAYRAEYGDDHERTRFAAEGLARLQEQGGAASPAASGQEQAPARKAADAKAHARGR